MLKHPNKYEYFKSSAYRPIILFNCRDKIVDKIIVNQIDNITAWYIFRSG
jgi:hypothetical protein